MDGLAELVLIALASATTWMSSKPPPKATSAPNPTASWDMRLLVSNIYLAQIALITVMGCEFVVVVAGYLGYSLPFISCTFPTSSGAMVYAGLSCMFLGSTLRIWCYTVMGSMFTFRVSIQPNHKLITTGPYAYVRHPSYLGTLVRSCGIAILAAAAHRGEFAAATCGPAGYLIEALLVCLTLFYGISTVILLRRADSEDRMLHKHFGVEWEKWASRTTNCYLPGII